MIALRCPPWYCRHGIGGPAVRIVRPVMPGSTSPAGRTSISTGSAPVIRLTASALACARSAAAATVACPPLTATPFLRRKVSPQPQVPGLLPFGDDGVVFLPFGALVF